MIDVEHIKALDPGKVYVVEIDALALGSALAEEFVSQLMSYEKELGLKFILMVKGLAKIISAPEGLEVIQK